MCQTEKTLDKECAANLGPSAKDDGEKRRRRLLQSYSGWLRRRQWWRGFPDPSGPEARVPVRRRILAWRGCDRFETALTAANARRPVYWRYGFPIHRTQSYLP